MTKVVYETSFHNFDTASYKELQGLLLKWKKTYSVDLLNDLKVSIMNLASHGLEMEIPELSVKNIHYKGEDLGGFKLNATLKMKEDENLAAKMLFSPLFIFQNIDFKVYLSISKKIYQHFIMNEIPFAVMIPNTTKANSNDLLYDISYMNRDLKINGKRIF